MSPLTNTVSLLLPFSCALQPISPWDLVSNYSGYRFYSNVIQPYDAFRVISRLHMTTLGSQFSSCCKCAFTHVCLSAPKFLYLVKYTFLTFIQLFFFYVSIFSRSLYYLMKCPISCFPTFKKPIWLLDTYLSAPLVSWLSLWCGACCIIVCLNSELKLSAITKAENLYHSHLKTTMCVILLKLHSHLA